MHQLEPFYNWRHLYIASQDERSPYYGHLNSEVYFTDQIYGYYIHPQWDPIGSETLFIKQLYADYDMGFTIIEMIGEWNDCLHNDIMFLKRDIIDKMIAQGIDKFILIGENVLNFHASDELYYEEWFDDIEDGWVALVNFRDFIQREMSETGIDQYFVSGGQLQDFAWRTADPQVLYKKADQLVQRRLDPV
ncbi:hypothetical protein HZ996_07280 [Cryomorphaceae bacterium]|nr:hypothetical protein HZ996_07280 [Cryomorphaceae bacterium]